MPLGNRISPCRLKGMHVWPPHVGPFFPHHPPLLSTNRPCIGLHSPYTVLGMVQNHFAWLPCVDPPWQVGCCYIHDGCRIWRIVSCLGVSPLLLISLALGCDLRWSKHLPSYSQ